jgi:hypothetical protein
MTSTTWAAPVSRKRNWAGAIVTGLPVLFLLFDSVIKLMQIQPVKDSFTQLGYPLSLAPIIGTIELVCLALYLLPRTSVLGAILLTGYLGGAVATVATLVAPSAAAGQGIVAYSDRPTLTLSPNTSTKAIASNVRLVQARE